MRRFKYLWGLVIIEMLSCTTLVEAKTTLDISEAKNGVLYVETDEDSKVVLRLEKEDTDIKFVLPSKNKKIAYPLTQGNGKYNITVLKNTNGNKYEKLISETVNMKLDNENNVYLNSTIDVNWKESKLVKSQAKEITKDCKTNEEKVKAVYDYMVTNYTYDYAKATIGTGTCKPDIDEIIGAKTGICYDYSAVFAGMLRSLDIPAKLVKGYNVNDMATYHAWNMVLIDGEWKVIDTTNDAYKISKGIDTDVYKDAKEFLVKVEG